MVMRWVIMRSPVSGNLSLNIAFITKVEYLTKLTPNKMYLCLLTTVTRMKLGSKNAE